jgi:hypothetical protein
MNDPNAAAEQIRWEYLCLRSCDGILFWFSRGSLNPIVLFEYGKELGRRGAVQPRKKLFVGCDPEYSRKQDVRLQTMLEDSDIMIHSSLDLLAERVKEWAELPV